MKTVIVLGSGNSGAGGVRDYLMSRDDFQSPFIDQEFRIINDPDGINDLYVNLYKNFFYLFLIFLLARPSKNKLCPSSKN